jgi:nicotinamidase-related amidase
MAACYDPAASAGRSAAVDPARAALIFIDTQNYNCHREGAIFSGASGSPEHVSCARRGGPVWGRGVDAAAHGQRRQRR